jgi:hypothetical protein
MKPGELVRGIERRLEAATVSCLPEGVVRLEGRIETASATQELERHLRLFHEQVKQDTKTVVLDVAPLEWVSERAVTILVNWVHWIQREPEDRRYGIVFRINAAIPWQRGTFRALVAVAPEVVSVEGWAPAR